MIQLPLPISSHTKQAAVREAWREQVRPLLRSLYANGDSFEFLLDCYGPWRLPNGKRNRKMPDASRMLTLLEDLVQEATGINDNCNDRIVVQRFQSEQTYCTLIYRQCPPLFPSH